MNKKKLEERRAELLETMENIRKDAEAEERAFTENEDASFRAAEQEIGRIDTTLRAMDATRSLHGEQEEKPEEQLSTDELEIRAFASIVRNRADANITLTDNGAVVPTTIAQKIIDRVYDICPIFNDAEKFNITGKVAIPYVDTDNDNIAVAYADEFTDLESTNTKLLTVELEDNLAGVLVKISKSLLNQSDLALTEFVIDKIATAIALFLENETLNGTEDKIEGLSGATNIIEASSSSAITMDDLVKVQGALKTVYQSGAYWVMAPDTFTEVKLLKDTNGRYLVEPDPTNAFGWTLLGKPVYTSDQAAEIAAGNKPVYYVNPGKALAGKLAENSVQVLYEKYATQHALGIVAWIAADAEVQNQQAVAVLQMATA